MWNLQRRAAVHAAVGDPARLQIVDALLLSDASPQHLAALTDMGSNLVAHHLGVLEAQGLIARSRSQGDRRRTYIHLVGGALDGLLFPSRQLDRRVLFVCTANSARSQLAAALWRRASDVPADSAGTHPAERIEPRAIAVARRHRVALPRRRPRRLDLNEGADLIVTVCDQAHEELERMQPQRDSLHWSVPDPVPLDNDDAFEDAFAEIAERVQRLHAATSPTA